MVAAPDHAVELPSANPPSAVHQLCCHATAFDALVREHEGRWVAIARRMLGSDHDAADAVQEAYVAALGSLDRFRGEALPSTWVHRIVVNVCLMKLRSRRGRLVHAMDDDLGSTSDADELVVDEARRFVRECISQLPDAYRDVLVLRDMDERDTGETARLLRLAPGAVKTRLHRARRALRAILEQSAWAEQFALGV
jgi:RNA polymerase sigma-70 factor (ECF subfamily)